MSLWTAGAGSSRAGLTVSSLMVATGEPPQLVGLLDPDSELAETLAATGRGVVQLLQWEHRQLAEMFAGQAPAPGGAFAQAAWVDTAWGPRLADAATWAGVHVAETRAVGWSLLVAAAVEHLEVGADTEPLGHRRGRWERLAR